MKLSDLLTSIAETSVDYQIEGLCLDSRKINAGDLFIALNGALQHGLAHAQQAVGNGAAAVIYDPEGIQDAASIPADFIAVPRLSQQLGEIAARFYKHPSQNINVIGITGTNGKTTCSQLLAQAVNGCGVIGTVGWGSLGQLRATANTTPDALDVQRMLSVFVEEGKQAVAMEVSSHGLEQGRVNAVDFKGAVFTNLSRDHLDYHGNMAAYLQAKLSLFKNPALRFAVVNLDDASSGEVFATLHGKVKRWGFSIHGRQVAGAECVLADKVRHRADGMTFDLHWQQRTISANTPVVGAFNLQNIMAVLCVLLALGWPFEKAAAQLPRLQAVTGRMESFSGQGKPAVIVDYAHTPDALEKVLLAARGHGELWAVFGCGGDRDKGKRPLMGRIAETYADHVVVTDDNPRSEASEAIIRDILSGCSSDKISVINDRNTAITAAILQANPGDCIVVAGKGHENYQEIQGVKIPFSDQTVVQQALAAWSPRT